MPGARYAKAVIGTPGWYTMPRFDVAFPYGLRGSTVTPASLKVVLRRNVVLLLGSEDTDPNHEELRKTPEAMAQGPNRVVRGKTFFHELQKRAAEMRTPLNWRIMMVPGAAHEPSKMSPSAATVLMSP
jgi:hypothetical protein